MTRWPLCLAEIALYAVIAGLLIAMGLDARARWKQLHEEPDQDEHDDALERDDGAEVSAVTEGSMVTEVSAVRPKPDGAPDDTDPPPLAA